MEWEWTILGQDGSSGILTLRHLEPILPPFEKQFLPDADGIAVEFVIVHSSQTWNGLDEAGVLVPDGNYPFRIDGRSVRIDTPGSPASTGATSPMEVEGLVLGKTGQGITFSWNPVTTDVFGKAITAQDYNGYRGTRPDFTPDTQTFSNRIASTSELNAIDNGTDASPEASFYLVTAVDTARNESGAQASRKVIDSFPEVTGEVGVDDTPPVITASIDPPPNENMWNGTSVTVNFTCTDSFSGVETCQVPVAVDGDCVVQDVTGTTLDIAGNIAVTSVPIRVDVLPPSIVPAATPPSNVYGWNNTDVTVSFEARDACSGLLSVTPPTRLEEEGADQSVPGTAMDLAGNAASATARLSIDKTPPRIEITDPPPGTIVGSSPIDVRGTVTDANPILALGCNSVPGTVTRNTFTCVGLPLAPGTNPITVNASDIAGNRGSSGTTVDLAVAPDFGLHVQLVWDRDGTDLDLHLLDAIATEDRFGPSGWFSPVNDCFSLNGSPDWGILGNFADNPRLNIDDVNGFGPENIRLAEPEAKTYTIGVHYFCDAGLGPSRATVRTFCDGVLAGEFSQPLAVTGEFWEAAQVTFPGCAVRPIGATTTVSQGCAAPPGTCDGLMSLSTVVFGHDHSLCVPAADLSNPPAGGSVYMTSSSAGHAHTVILSQAELQTIRDGGTVFVNTSVVEGHTHDFVISAIPAMGLVCQILTPPSPLRQGQTLTFVAVTKNASGAFVPGQSFTWSSDNTNSVEIDSSGVATGGSATGVANITCRVAGGSPIPSAPVAVHNYANAEAGVVRAVVVDERTGAPLAGASVRFEPVGAVVTSDGFGIAQVPATGTVDVHAFMSGYSWVSIIGTNATDILVPMAPTPDDTKAGGFKGGFDLSLVPNPQSEVEFGFAGASLAGSFVDLDLEKLIGGIYRRRVQVGSLFDDYIALPSGLVLKIGDTAIQGEYTVLAEPGLRHGWGIGGKISFSELLAVLTPILSGGTDPGDLPFGQIIPPLLRLFENFLHFVKTDILVTEVPKVPDTGDINGDGSTTDLVPDFANPVGFPTVAARVNQALTLSTSVTVPPLPRYNNKPLESVIILSGANVTGRGLVPLGLSAAVDAPVAGETPDGLVDVDPATPGNQSTVAFKMSPLHDGLEGSRFFLATLAVSLRLDGGPSTSVSGIITQTNQVDPTASLSVSSFLGFPETASFNLATRTFDLGTHVPNAAFHRADFKSQDGDWVVYFKAPAVAGTPAFVLPPPPVGIDRAVLACVNSEAASQPCASLRVLTLATTQCLGASAPGLDAIATFGTVNLTKLNDCLSAFSSQGCQKNGNCAPPAMP